MKTTTLAIAAAMAAGTMTNTTVAQTTWTVCQDGSCDFATIQQAVDAAADGDTVEIGPGTYTSDDPSVVNIIGKSVHVISVAGPDATIIDGQNMRRGLYIQSTGSPPIAFTGFTVRRCVADASLYADNNRGAGLLIRNNAVVAVRNCVFHNNFAPYQGAAICADQSSSVDISDCMFSDNSVGPPPYWTDWPGATVQIRAEGGGTSCTTFSSAGFISRCLFVNNNAPAIACSGLTTPLIASNIFVSRTAHTARTPLISHYCDNNASQLRVVDSTIQMDAPIEYAAVTALSSDATLAGLAIGASIFCGEQVGVDDIEGPWTDLGHNVFGGQCSLRVDAMTAAMFDCNANGVFDFFETLDGVAIDLNANGVPDTCECFADVNQDGQVNGADISVLLGFWGLNGKPVAADINKDGQVDGADLAAMLGGWGACP